MDQSEDAKLLIEGQLLSVAQWCKIASLLLCFHGILGMVVHGAGGAGQLGSLPVLVIMTLVGGGLYGVARQLEDYTSWVQPVVGGVAAVACLLAGILYLHAQSTAPINAAPSLWGWIWFLMFGGMIAYGVVLSRGEDTEPRIGVISSGLLLLGLLAPLVGTLGVLHYATQAVFIALVIHLLMTEHGAIALGVTTLLVVADAARGREDILWLAAIAYFGVLADLFLISPNTRAFFEDVAKSGKPDTWESELPTFQNALFTYPLIFLSVEVFALVAWATGCPDQLPG